MQRPLSMLVACALVATGGPALAGTHATGAFKGAKLLPMARVPLATARATALKARPGKVTDEELEKEAGGSGLRYSFDIKSGAKAYEVGIDAKTGRVLENAAEGKHPD